MAATYQLLDMLDQFESYESNHGHIDTPHVQEYLDGTARDIAHELLNLRPLLESQNFVYLLESFEGRL